MLRPRMAFVLLPKGCFIFFFLVKHGQLSSSCMYHFGIGCVLLQLPYSKVHLPSVVEILQLKEKTLIKLL